MLKSELPTSITEIKSYRQDPVFRWFVEEHWAVLRPLCEQPIRIEKSSQYLRVIIFDAWFLERGLNFEYIRFVHLGAADMGDYEDDDPRLDEKRFTAAGPFMVFRHLRGLRSYEDRFATELAEKPDGGWARVNTPKHLSLDGYNAWVDDGGAEPLTLKLRILHDWDGSVDSMGLGDGQNYADCVPSPLPFHQGYLFHQLLDHSSLDRTNLLRISSIWIELIPHLSGTFKLRENQAD